MSTYWLLTVTLSLFILHSEARFPFLLIYTVSISSCLSSSIDYLRTLSHAQVANITAQQLVDSWQAYKQYAWGCDALYPQARGCHNYAIYSNMWTPIDALDTMKLMGLDDLVSETVDLLCSTPYNGGNNQSKFTFLTDQNVYVFDYMIRSLGGLISAYYFTNNSCLYDLAVEVSDGIYPIFNEATPSKSGLPWTHLNLKTGEVDKSYDSTSPAEAGTHTLEYGIMSVITGDLKYWNASMNVMRILYEAKSEELGLIGIGIYINETSNVSSPNFFRDTEASISSGIDSYYEYIVKCWALFNNTECRHWWLDRINASLIDNLSYYNKNSKGDDLLWFKHVDMHTGFDKSYTYDLFSPFFSSVLSLSSVLADDENNLRLSKLNQEANWHVWSKYDIEPWSYDFKNDYEPGIAYNLNPENFESNYYLYMITNDSLYYDRALMYLDDLMTYCKCDGIYNLSGTNCVGYTGMEDVIKKRRSNSQPSYWFAESLKYLYLTFMRNEPNNPLPFDEYVFNTEAHPYPKSWGFKLNDMIKHHSSSQPTKQTTSNPTSSPINVSTTHNPTTKHPTRNPTTTRNPTKYPTRNPTKYPTRNLTKHPTKYPTRNPTTKYPTRNPTKYPTIYVYPSNTTTYEDRSESHKAKDAMIVLIAVCCAIIFAAAIIYYYFIRRRQANEAQSVNFQMLKEDAPSINA